MLIWLNVFGVLVYLVVCVQGGGRFHKIALGVYFSFFAIMGAQFISEEYFKYNLIPDSSVYHATSHIIGILVFWIGLSFAGDAVFIIGCMLLLGPFWNSARIHTSSWLGVDQDGWAVITVTILTYIIVLLVVQMMAGSRVFKFLFNMFFCTLYATISVNISRIEGFYSTELCCTMSGTTDDTCPIGLSIYLLITFPLLFIVRLILYKVIQRKCMKRTKKQEEDKHIYTKIDIVDDDD